ncbi:MAG: hypothetical protein NTW21_37090 [Verrucomicrobia bacterium]|nr:hypothetical protein [Verrucomicrobiota bacterium]
MKTATAPPATASVARPAPLAPTQLVALGIHLLGFTASATAAPGDLDPTFGTGGRVIFEQSAAQESWDHFQALPNGDILVAGWTGTNDGYKTGRYIVRLNKDGAPVTSFGTAGQVTLSGTVRDMVALPGGKILVALVDGGGGIIRLQSNGSLDLTFHGDGSGVGAAVDNLCGMAVDVQGRIVLAGSDGTRVEVKRLTAEGNNDGSFAGGRYPIGNWAWATAMALQADGKIVVVGWQARSVGDPQDLWVVRFLANGGLDPGFASGGKLVLDIHGENDRAEAVLLRPNGKIVVVGGTPQDSLFVGLNQDGTLDASFGSGGIVEIDAGAGYFDIANAATLMPDGRIIASSTVSYSGGGSRFAAIRLMPNGAPDSTFAPGGIVQIPGTEDSGWNWAHDIARGASGGIFVIGGAENPSGQGGMLVRLKGDPDSDGDGIVDSSETGTGVFVSAFDTGTNPLMADTDGDGLTDGREAYEHGSNPNLPDTDGDGFLDGYEVQTGKSPTDPLDKPALVAEARTAIEFTFPSAIGKTYRIEGSPDMAAWTVVEDGITGNGGVITRFYSTRNHPQRFLRVEESP